MKMKINQGPYILPYLAERKVGNMLPSNPKWSESLGKMISATSTTNATQPQRR